MSNNKGKVPAGRSTHSLQEVVDEEVGTGMIDPEFESIYNRVVWLHWDSILKKHDLVVQEVSPATGELQGEPTTVDTDVLGLVAESGYNGPEWSYNESKTHIGNVWLIYAKKHADNKCYLYRAFQTGAKLTDWDTAPLENPSNDYVSRAGVICSVDFSKMRQKITYIGKKEGDPKNYTLWRYRDEPDSENEKLPFEPDSGQNYEIGIGRWVPGTDKMISSLAGPEPRQVSVFDVGTENHIYLTSDAEYRKGDTFSWESPHVRMGESPDYMFLTTIEEPGGNPSSRGLRVYRQKSDGFEILSELPPDNTAEYPYVLSPEPFKFKGVSYVAFLLSKNRYTSNTAHSIVCVAPVSALQNFKIVSNLSPRKRTEPEPYVGKDRVWIYYSDRGTAGQKLWNLRRCDALSGTPSVGVQPQKGIEPKPRE